jgi:hypothetical protein
VLSKEPDTKNTYPPSSQPHIITTSHHHNLTFIIKNTPLIHNTDIMKIPAWVTDGTEVDEDTYGKDLDMTNISQITAAQATGHLINFFNNCKEEKWRDKKLWIEFREDFEGWNVKL